MIGAQEQRLLEPARKMSGICLTRASLTESQVSEWSDMASADGVVDSMRYPSYGARVQHCKPQFELTSFARRLLHETVVQAAVQKVVILCIRCSVL
jgi:hypothetical protein